MPSDSEPIPATPIVPRARDGRGRGLAYALAFAAFVAIPVIAHAAKSGGQPTDEIAAAEEVQSKFFQFGFDEFGKKFPYRFGIDLASVIALIGGVYFPLYRKKDF